MDYDKFCDECCDSFRYNIGDYREVERNGSLALVECISTGQQEWVDTRNVDGWY